MRYILYHILLSVLFLFINSSCVEREEHLRKESDEITFSATLKGNDSPHVKSSSQNFTSESEEWDLYPSTKVPITTQLPSSAKVLGYLYSESFASDVPQWDVISGAQFHINGDELVSEPSIRWGQISSSYNYLRVYAYTPVEIEGAVMPTVGSSAKGAPIITYTLPLLQKDQTDIIAAVKDIPSDYRKSIPLTFTHALTALEFKMAFACTVNSITISGVYNKADYTVGGGWSNHSKYPDDALSRSYVLDLPEGGKTVAAGGEINTDENVMMMIPQTLPDGATITVSYTENGVPGTISADLKGIKWEPGKLIKYTLHKKSTQNYIYIDLAAGNFTIKDGTYTGYVYINNGTETYTVTGTHNTDNKYYVYQSTEANKTSTGWSAGYNSTHTLPSYDKAYIENAAGNKTLWSDYITNNASVTKVIKAWDDKAGATSNAPTAKGAVRNVGRTVTNNYIDINGAVGNCDLYIDNIYSKYTDLSTSRGKGSISFKPSSTGTNSLIVNIIGDNRLTCVHYNPAAPQNKLIFQGVGSLTVADADYNTAQNSDGGEFVNGTVTDNDTTFFSNHWNSAIGNNDGSQEVYGIEINGGVIFAGTTKAENCTAIGGGGNGYGDITINGGVVTAVATTTGTAIGGGIGFNSAGGKGKVVINGGNVYAYNHANHWGIPSSAIGGAGSRYQGGSEGIIDINGGNIYAQSALGTAIGGGSSATKAGGAATIYIKDGIVIAKSLQNNSAGIGGGSTCTFGGTVASGISPDGGNATIFIGKDRNGVFGNPILRTGSIGGGATSATGGKIGSAIIDISGGDVQAQFVLAASDNNEFNMSGGTIRNSYSTDSDYKHVKLYGGAVYMEQGNFTMSGGTIQNCSAQLGGAVYLKGSSGTTFTMSGGTIKDCISETHGGAVYLEQGNVILSGGTIFNNLASIGNGGGIYVLGGNLSIPAGSTVSIEENAAYSRNASGCGSGGGIYVTSEKADLEVDILSGKIIGNTSDRSGGGISVDLGGKQNVSALVTVGHSPETLSETPLISGNRTSIWGGGLFVNGENANIIINNGKITGNFTTGYVANPDVANEGGMVTLNGGTVTHVTVTYDANGGYIEGAGAGVTTATQKIVTSTKSRMVLPGTFSRLGWTLTGWHTRADGDNSKGTFYATGSVLNLSEDLTLYAQWSEE